MSFPEKIKQKTIKNKLLETLQKLKDTAMKENDMREWIYTPSERRSDPCGGAYDIELTKERENILWVQFVDVQNTILKYADDEKERKQKLLQCLKELRHFYATVVIPEDKIPVIENVLKTLEELLKQKASP